MRISMKENDMDEFRNSVQELTGFLAQLKDECDQFDRNFQSVESRIDHVKEKEGTGIYSSLSERFEHIWNYVKPFEKNAPYYLTCKAFFQNEIYPYICVGGLNNMVFNKPFGYAGDYLTIYNYFLDYAGERTYEILINQFSRSIPIAVAHRNRIPLLIEEIKSLSVKGGNILSVGCGPAIEIQRTCQEVFFQKCNFTLFDADDRAINFVEQHLPAKLPNVKLLSSSILSPVKSHPISHHESYDLIYCCGLYDYLSDKVAIRILRSFFNTLKPGGKIIITNVSSDVQGRGYFEFFADWDLILRSEDDMLNLAQKCSPETNNRICKDSETESNIYLYVEKSAYTTECFMSIDRKHSMTS
jgi:extracellular factor (EF) 3-hydroxypalmitic acid methyl ester biosynthesis protein